MGPMGCPGDARVGRIPTIDLRRNPNSVAGATGLQTGERPRIGGATEGVGAPWRSEQSIARLRAVQGMLAGGPGRSRVDTNR